jgi:polyhydroxyalkanoate synthesis regulator phasin
MTTRFERVFAVACALLLTISMATAGVGFATAPAAAQSDTNGTATVSDTFEAYEVGTNNPGPWTAPSGSSGSAVVGDSFLGDRALEVTDSDGAAIYDGATVDSNDAAVQAVIRGTNAGGYIEYGGVTLEVNTGEFTNRLRLSDGTDETIVDGAAPTAGEWANVELIADGGDLEATIWPVGTDKPNSSDIELTGVDATGDLEVSTVNTDDVLTVDEVSVQPYSTLGSQTVSGTVTDQYDEPVPNATVQAIGVTQGALGGDDLEAEADALLDELSDPLPDAFNPDADLGDQYANADGTYAAVHPASAWNLGGVSLGSNAVSPAVTPSLDTPDVVLPADEQLIVSTWDAGDTGGALSQDGVDGSLPGATTADPVVIEQLGPTGETTHTRTVDPQPLVEVTALANLGTKTHEGAVVDLPPGIYRVYPEESSETPVVVAVGEPAALANTIETDLRDDADRLTARADRVQALASAGDVTDLSAETNATGVYSMDVPSSVEALHLQAFGVDGDTQAVLDTDAENASLATVRDAYSDGYNGTLALSTEPVRATPPDEQADLTVQRLDAPPVASPDAFAARLDAWANDTLDTRLSDLAPTIVDDLAGEELSRDDLAAVHEDLDALREQNDALDERLRDRLENPIENPGDADRDALREEVASMQRAVADLQHTIDAETPTTDLSDGTLAYETVFDATIPAEAVAVTATYGDGTTERVPDEYVTVDQEGIGPLSSTAIAIEEYPVPDGTEVADVRVQVAGADRLGESRERVASAALDSDLASLDAITVSTLDPGPDDRVTLGVDADEQTRIVDVAARNPAGESVTATVDDGQATVHTDGQGLHAIALTYEQSGIEVTETLRIEAGATSGSTPATVRLAEGASGTYAITSGLAGATVDTSGDELTIEARAESGDAPSAIHLHPQSAMSGDTDTLAVEVVQADGETSLDRHASVYVHTTGLADDALLWRGDAPITRAGDTQYGEVLDRGDGKAVVSTYTDADGAVTVDVRHDPNALERVQHWTAARSPFAIPGLSG